MEAKKISDILKPKSLDKAEQELWRWQKNVDINKIGNIYKEILGVSDGDIYSIGNITICCLLGDGADEIKTTIYPSHFLQVVISKRRESPEYHHFYDIRSFKKFLREL